MSKILEALEILKELGLPKQQQNERSALTLLALAGIKESSSWTDISRTRLRIVDIMKWMSKEYKKTYAPNTRETIRRQTIHQFEQARIVDRNPDDITRPTTSGHTVYQLTEEVIPALKSYNSSKFRTEVQKFIKQHGTLSAKYLKEREFHKIPVRLTSGKEVHLSPGDHNELQKHIVREFASRFAPNSLVLYLGDTAEKDIYIDSLKLNELNIIVTKHDKLPDIVLYDEAKKWLFLIEAVTTHGPVSPKRYHELEQMFGNCPVGRIYVTAFLSFSDFKKYATEIAWESEVWIAEIPDHMIHYNGDRFIGPR